MGWDINRKRYGYEAWQISIHPPRMGWDPAPGQPGGGMVGGFQSTHPAWGGTADAQQ